MDCNRLTLCCDAGIVGPWVCEQAGGTWVAGRGTAIGRVKDGRLVAGVLYEDFTGANIICHIRGEPGWASKQFLAVIFDYPFVQLGCRRITAPVASTNANCISLVRAMGFDLECTLERANPDSDILLFRMFKDQCRYLNERFAKHAV